MSTLSSISTSSNYSIQSLPNELLVVILSTNEFEAIDLAKASKGMFEETLKAQRAYELNRLYDFRSDLIQNLDQAKNKSQITCLNALRFTFPQNIPNFVKLRQAVDTNLESIVDELKAVDLEELGDLSIKRNHDTFVHTKQDLYPYYFYSVFRDAAVCKAVMNQNLFQHKPFPMGFGALTSANLNDFGVITYDTPNALIERVAKRHPIERLINIGIYIPNEETQYRLIEKYCGQPTGKFESGAIDKLFDFALTLSNREMKSKALSSVSSAFARIGQLFKARVIASCIPDDVERQKTFDFIHIRHKNESLSTDETIKPKKFHCDIGVKFFSS